MTFIKTHLKIIFIGIIAIVLIIFGINSYNKIRKNSANSYDPNKDTIVNAKRENIKEEIILAGSIDASGKADLSFQTSGQLAWLGVKVGDQVKKYQAIASLNKDQLRKQLQMSFNNYKSSLSTFHDTQDVYKTEKENNNLTDEMKRILDRTQNTLDNSVITYELNDLAIRYATLTTPIAGVVTSIDTPSSGINITPASTISIIDPKSIYLRAEIDQEDVIKIKVGDKATIKLDSFSDKTFNSTVDYISFTPVPGQTSTVYEIRLKLPEDNSKQLYRLGMDGDVAVELRESPNTLTIPIDAVQEENGQQFVFVKDPSSNQLIKKNIKTGIETDSIVEVLEGISENDQIVIKQK